MCLFDMLPFVAEKGFCFRKHANVRCLVESYSVGFKSCLSSVSNQCWVALWPPAAASRRAVVCGFKRNVRALWAKEVLLRHLYEVMSAQDSIAVNLHRRLKDQQQTGSAGSSHASHARVTLPSGYIPSNERVKTTASSGPFVTGNVPAITVNDNPADGNEAESIGAYQCYLWASKGAFPLVDFSRGGKKDFFTGSNSDEMSFYQLETKRNTFFY